MYLHLPTLKNKSQPGLSLNELLQLCSEYDVFKCCEVPNDISQKAPSVASVKVDSVQLPLF